MLKKLLTQYYTLFPKSGMVAEFVIIPDDDRVKMLKEAIKDKKEITETELYKKKYNKGV